MAHQANTAKTIHTAPAQAGILATYGALPITGFVRLSDLRPIIPFSDSTLWRRVKNQTFPAPLRLSERVTAWRAEDIRQWLDEQGQAA
ncbi:phage transcriptional regulator, AlpA [Pseudogulbenkiania sp. NH8B]|uniref:helix-turn-helix transcriptional regulator n=1 Tax=Pseudogulbenkiania sp. (strain NH8B) TaxID=748280 RepID=UPI0002279473|nr:AlpA family phage regulatory protein [Pseudogulbenkiania sp. NH8B]BAK75347.1 phage transcriptional regulator, AlpA [Pseudogulbenkiania sp. NH8B]